MNIDQPDVNSIKRQKPCHQISLEWNILSAPSVSTSVLQHISEHCCYNGKDIMKFWPNSKNSAKCSYELAGKNGKIKGPDSNYSGKNTHWG